jgi:hypothetical protein
LRKRQSSYLSNMCSTQADNNSWKLRLRCGCVAVASFLGVPSPLELCIQHRKSLIRTAGTLNKIQSCNFSNTEQNCNYRAVNFSPRERWNRLQHTATYKHNETIYRFSLYGPLAPESLLLTLTLQQSRTAANKPVYIVKLDLGAIQKLSTRTAVINT